MLVVFKLLPLKKYSVTHKFENINSKNNDKKYDKQDIFNM